MQQQREIEGAEHRRAARTVVITSPNPYKLRALLTREHRRKAILIRSDIVEVRPGVWGARVVQLRPIRPAWVRPALVTSAVVSGVAGLGGLGWALASLLVAPAAGTVLGGVVVTALLVLLIGRLMGGGGSGGGGPACQIDISVTHRHR